jgi:hypothetical protein
VTKICIGFIFGIAIGLVLEANAVTGLAEAEVCA